MQTVQRSMGGDVTKPQRDAEEERGTVATARVLAAHRTGASNDVSTDVVNPSGFDQADECSVRAHVGWLASQPSARAPRTPRGEFA